MSRGGGKSGKTGRAVAPDEAELWSRLAGTLDKVKSKPRVTSHSGETRTSPPAPQASQDVPATLPASPKGAQPQKAPLGPPAPAQRAPPLAVPDRRELRQIASGKISIDARLDLHGARQRDARTRLRGFLLDAQARGHRTVLVITGKGGEAGTADPLAGALGEPQRGVLKRSVPQWLEEPDMRAVVLSYATAGARHGGDGALYVRLRKGRDAG
jgi:DNA-nicking Smr family endonuclease